LHGELFVGDERAVVMADAGDHVLPATARVIAANITNYAELIEALRGRLHQLDGTMEAVDELGGLPLRYTSKIFAPFPIKRLGAVSLGPILGALCTKLVLVEDKEMLDRVGHRIIATRRNARTKMPAQRTRRYLVFKGNPELAR